MSKYKNYYNNSTNTKQVTKKKTKKDWTYWVVVIALAFTFIGSILGTVAFAKSCVSSSKKSVSTFNSVNYNLDNKNNSSFSAIAFDVNGEENDGLGNTTKYFNSSNLYFPLGRFSYTNNAGNYNYTNSILMNFDFNLEYFNSAESGMFSGYGFNFTLNPIDNSNTTYYTYFERRIGNTVLTSNDYFPFNDGETPDINSYNSAEYYFRFGERSSSVKYQAYLIINYKNNNFNALDTPITKIEVGNEQVDWSTASSRHYISAFTGTTSQNLYYFNTVKYYQSEYLVAEFGFLTYNAPNSSYLLENRSYYTLNGIEGNSDYQLGFNNGKQEGLREGIATGTEDGFERGKIIGEQLGYDRGYRQGLNDSNSNSFYSLIGAVIDVPIGALQSLLNFELLGFNLFNFLTALVTLGLIIFVVRLFI